MVLSIARAIARDVRGVRSSGAFGAKELCAGDSKVVALLSAAVPAVAELVTSVPAAALGGAHVVLDNTGLVEQQGSCIIIKTRYWTTGLSANL